jgi:ribosomal protein L21
VPTPSYVSLSEKYAVVDAAGTQMLLEEGRWYTCNRLQAEPGSTIEFGRVLALKDNGTFTAGRPYLENVTVQAEILEELKGPKVIVYKMKPKKHYRRKNGHRQPLTKFLVTKINQA